MIALLLMLSLTQTPCEPGASGAQCVTCTGNERGTVVCRGVCWRKGDAGSNSKPLQAEDKEESEAKKKVDQQAKEKCG